MQDKCIMCGSDVSDMGRQVCENCEHQFILLHSKGGCIRHSKWKNGELRCDVCNSLIAIAYQIGDNINIYKFPQYKNKSLSKKLKGLSVLKKIDFSDFDKYLEVIKNDSITY